MFGSGLGNVAGVGDIVAFLGIGGLDNFKQGLTAADTAAANSAKNMNKTLTVALAAGTAAFGAMVVAAGQYESKIADIGTLMTGDPAGFKKLSGDLLELSESVPITATALAGLGYEVVSATVPASDSLRVLEQSAKGAIAGVADSSDTFNLFSAVVKGYGYEWSEVGSISDIAFKTIELGQTKMSELATSMQGAIPLASELGIDFEELAGITATLTGVTGNTSEVMTQAESVMTALIKGSNEMDAAFKALGVGSGKELIEKFGTLGNAMDALKGYTEKYDVSIGKVLGRKEAMLAYYALTGTQSDTLRQKTEAMYNAMGATDRAFEVQMGTLENQAKLLKNVVVGAFIEAGQNTALPIMTDLLEVLNDHPGAVKGVVTSLSALAVGLGGLAGTAKGIRAVGGALTMITSLPFGPAGLALAGIVAAITAVNSAMNVYWSSKVNAIDSVSEEISALETLEGRFNTLWNEQDLTEQQQIELKTVTDELKKRYSELGLEIDVTSKKFANMNIEIAKQRQEELQKQTEKLEKQIKSANGKLDTMNKNLSGRGGVTGFGGSGQGSLAFGVKGLSDNTKNLNDQLQASYDELEELDLYIKNKSVKSTNSLGTSVENLGTATGTAAGAAKALTDNLKTQPLVDIATVTGEARTVQKDYNEYLTNGALLVSGYRDKLAVLKDAHDVLKDPQQEHIDRLQSALDLYELTPDEQQAVKDAMDKLAGSTEAANYEWADYAGFLDQMIQKLPGIPEPIKSIGSSLATMVTSGFNPATVALGAINIGLELFGGSKEIVQYTVDDIIGNMGLLGDEILATQEIVDDLSQHFSSSLVETLEAQIDEYLQQIADLETIMQRIPETFRDSAEKNIAILEDLTEKAQQELAKLTAMFAGLYAFEGQKENIDYFVEESLRAFELLGPNYDYSGAIDLLNEQINMSLAIMATLDPQSEAYQLLAMSVYRAHGAVAVLNGEYATLDEYLIDHNIQLEDTTENVEEQTEAVKKLADMWELVHLAMFEGFDSATGKAAEANAILDQMEYYGIDFDETDMDERVGQIIKGMQDELSKLNPDSQAYKDLKAELDALIARMYDLQYGTDEMTTSTNNSYQEQQKEIEATREEVEALKNEINEKVELRAELKAEFDDLFQQRKDIIAEINEKQEAFDKIQLELELEMEGVQGKIDNLDIFSGFNDEGLQEYLMSKYQVTDMNELFGYNRDAFQNHFHQMFGGDTATIEPEQFKEKSILEMMQDHGNLGGFYELYEILEEITGVTKRLNIEWSGLLDNLFQDYDNFTSDMDLAADALSKLSYFGEDLEGSGVEGEINSAIVRMQDFLGTLDPDSEAYRDYKKQLDALIKQYQAMGGVIDRDAATEMFEQDVSDGGSYLQGILDELLGEYQQNEIEFTAEIQPLLDDLDVVDGKMKEVFDKIITLNVDISEAKNELKKLKIYLSGLEENEVKGRKNYDKRGNLVKFHSGGLNSDERLATVQANEFILRRDVTSKFGADRLAAFNNTLDSTVLGNSKGQINFNPVINPPTVIIKNPGPRTTWEYEYVDNTIQPRIKFNERNRQTTREPFKP